MISTQMAADIMISAFKTEFSIFKVNKSEFNVIVAFTSHQLEASKNDQTHTQTKKLFLRIIFKLGSNAP